MPAPAIVLLTLIKVLVIPPASIVLFPLGDNTTLPPPDSMISVPPALTKLVLAVAPDSTARTPPLLTVVLVSSPPLAISSVPPLFMVQWALLALVTVQAPPTTLKIVKPRYRAVAPMELRSNVSAPVPPSWNVLLPDCGSTVPLML
jgi:hypothetical protein